MNSALGVQLEIEFIGPEIGFAFWTNPIEGVAVEQHLFRAFPTVNADFASLQHTFLLIKDGALATAAVLEIMSVLKKLFGKHPDLPTRLALRVRVGTKVSDGAVEKLRELNCEVEFVREPAETFEASTMPQHKREVTGATNDDKVDR